MPTSAGAPRPLTDDWQWQLQGACRSFDPELFFHPADERGSSRAARERLAKQVCAGCPVRASCLEHALGAGEAHGVWGGLSEQERARLLAEPSRRQAG